MNKQTSACVRLSRIKIQIFWQVNLVSRAVPLPRTENRPATQYMWKHSQVTTRYKRNNIKIDKIFLTFLRQKLQQKNTLIKVKINIQLAILLVTAIFS